MFLVTEGYLVALVILSISCTVQVLAAPGTAKRFMMQKSESCETTCNEVVHATRMWSLKAISLFIVRVCMDIALHGPGYARNVADNISGLFAKENTPTRTPPKAVMSASEEDMRWVLQV